MTTIWNFIKSNTLLLLALVFAVGFFSGWTTDHFSPRPNPNPPVPVADISLPDQYTGDVGKYITVKATTKASEVFWMPSDESSVEILSESLSDPLSKLVTVSKPGKYKLYAFCCTKSGKSCKVCHTYTWLVVGGVPPNPGPSPDPNPVPTQLQKDLQAAFTSDGPSTSTQKCRDVAGVARGLVSAIGAGSIKTVGDAFSFWSTGVHGKLSSADMPATRKVFGAYLKSRLPNAVNAQMDQNNRQLFTTEFTTLATALEGLK